MSDLSIQVMEKGKWRDINFKNFSNEISIQIKESGKWKNINFKNINHDTTKITLGRPFRIIVNNKPVYDEKGNGYSYTINKGGNKA